MENEYIGTIKLFAGNFAPKNWAFCEGQLAQISENTALYSILGTTYGGDGRVTFGLPDLRGRIPVGAATTIVPGLTPYRLGETGGEVEHTLLLSEMGQHNHPFYVSEQVSNQHAAQSGVSAIGVSNTPVGRSPVITKNFGNMSTPAVLNPNTVRFEGGGSSHNNVQPTLGLNYIICCYGLYPPRP
ncbi:MAG: phage tail protein [Bacteroidetes bacterium]|nr:MAG: phage tail protein [Bacteroidota bacterium]